MANTTERKATGVERSFVLGADRLIRWVAIHWLALLNSLVFLYVGLPFLAPVLLANGINGPANTIYGAYGYVCHQFAFRSWYIGGEQIAYPRARADTDLQSFEAAVTEDAFFAGVDVSELDVDLVSTARNFRGNDQVGYKVAFCQRDVAIYGAIFLGGVAYAFVRKWLNPLKFWQYLIIGIAPIGLDGFSQLFANPPFTDAGFFLFRSVGDISQAIFGIRESTPLLRTLTGAMFGFANVWLAYPYLEEAMRDTRKRVEAQLRKAGIISGSA